MLIIKIESIPEPNCLSCVNHEEVTGEYFLDVYCRNLSEREFPYPACVEHEEQKAKVVFDVGQAIEDIAAKVHECWMQEKLTQGFADYQYRQYTVVLRTGL